MDDDRRGDDLLTVQYRIHHEALDLRNINQIVAGYISRKGKTNNPSMIVTTFVGVSLKKFIFAAAILVAISGMANVSSATLVIVENDPSSCSVVCRKLGEDPPPLKIFLLAGQSNMQGHGWIDARNKTTNQMLNATLEWLITNDPKEYGMLLQDNSVDDEGNLNWTSRDDVYFAFNYQEIGNVRPEILNLGYLKAGFGGPDNYHVMGPELGFGWTIGDAFNNNKNVDLNNEKKCNCNKQQVLLLKIAWGGRSLAVDYRPPSSATKDAPTGLYYTSMVATTYKVLNNLHDYVPHYYGQGYEMSGFVW